MWNGLAKSIKCSAKLWAAAGVLSLGAANADAALTWSTAVNQTSTVTNQLRAVDVADQSGNNTAYLGYIQTSGNRRVNQINDTTFANLNTLNSAGDQPKAIASDDRGNVFIAMRGSLTTSSTIQSFSNALGAIGTTTATAPIINGLDVYSVGSTYYAIATYETTGLIQRYTVTNTNSGSMIIDTTFGTAGSFNLAGSPDLRGVDVDAAGNIFAASRDGNKLYRISADLTTVTEAAVPLAMDVALYGGKAYVTSYNGAGSLIRVFNANTMAFVEDIIITTLDGNPYSRGTSAGFSGIDIDSDGRIFLADQHYGSTGGTQDRLLVSSAVPEPTGIALAAMGGGALLLRRHRRA